MASTFKRRGNPSMATMTESSSSTTDGSSSSSSSSSSNSNSSSISMMGLRGTKPWTGGITLTSSGLRDLDNILGGGQPLGTCILIEEDRWTESLSSSLVRYWCAEAISNGQHLLIPIVDSSTDENDFLANPHISSHDLVSNHSLPLGPTKTEILQFLDTLPRNLHWDKQQKLKALQEQEGMSTNTMLMETLEEEEEGEEGDDDDADKNEEGLKIAWQYRKNVQRERLGHDFATANKVSSRRSSSNGSDIYCHSYDLSGRLSAQLQENGNDDLKSLQDVAHLNPIQCCSSITSCPSKRACGFRLYQRLLQQLEDLIVQQPVRKVTRLLLHHFKAQVLSVALPLLLTQIRLKQLPVVVLVSIQPWKPTDNNSHGDPSKALRSLQRTSDVVLQTEGFAARSQYPPAPEFRHLHGLLLIRKVSTVTGATAIGGGHYADLTMSKRPPANIYGLKRDRRKLHIPLLHIPPEDHTEGGGSVGGGGVRSGAGRPASQSSTGGSGCGSGNQNSHLDF